MTAQKLTTSSSTDSHKAFRQAFQLKPNSERLYSPQSGPMSIPSQQSKHNQHQAAAAGAIEAERPQAWGVVTNSVETDSQDEERQHKRHQRLSVVTDMDTGATMPPVAAAGADAEADAAGAGGGGGGGAAIPMSPPSSPMHVVAVAAHPQDQLVVATAPAPAAVDATTTEPMAVERPPVVAPSPTSAAAPKVANGAAAPPPVVDQPPPAVPIRLGRGRKLCPSCKALTKSAVKQCRECKHVFNPASQRLRAQQQQQHQHQREPRGNNEEVPVLPRRRHRPSQRLLESLVEPEDPADAASAGGGAREALSSAVPPQRPLGAAAFGSGGDGNQRVTSGGAEAKTRAPPAGGELKEQQQQRPPKRSHKRKNPLPPGVAPPKRKKGAAAAARQAAAAAAAAAAETSTTSGADGPGRAAACTTTRGILPMLTLPEQERVVQDLLASPAPSRHTVPESPELAPMASPAGPLLFMSSSSASNLSTCPLEDDSEWLSPGAGAGGAGSVSPTTAFVEQQLRQQQQQQQQQQLFVADSVASLPGLLLDDNDDEEEEIEQQQRQRQQQRQQQQQQQQHVFTVRQGQGQYGSGINPDLSTEGQDRDPFADVEMWWEGGGGTAVVNPTAPATITTGVPGTFPVVGRDGMMHQRVVFPQNTNTELLGDADDALIWNPLLRASSAGETSGGGGGAANTGGPTAAVGTAAGRTLTLWPGSSNNDNHLLLPAVPSSSSSFFRGNRSRPYPENNVVCPTFERGAAIASAGGAGGSAAEPAHGRAEFLLAEASCSSLPDPLVLGDGGTAVAVAAAVSADSCGDGSESGGFWNPLL